MLAASGVPGRRGAIAGTGCAIRGLGAVPATVTVLNECRTADRRLKSVIGTAAVAKQAGPNTRLKVTFLWPFTGNYWIIDLDLDHRRAVAGEPGRDHRWILSREPRLDEALYSRILDSAKRQGYEAGRVIRTTHSL